MTVVNQHLLTPSSDDMTLKLALEKAVAEQAKQAQTQSLSSLIVSCRVVSSFFSCILACALGMIEYISLLR